MAIVSILVALGWLIFEVTAQPALGAVAVCVKFGWNDVLTARWLRQNDPNRRRAAACFWLLLASGYCKMAISAFVLMVGYALVAAMLQPPQPAQQGGGQADPFLPIFIAVAITWIIGFGLCGLATARALWLSLRFHIKLWLNPQLHQARRDNHRPPYGAGPVANRAELLILTTLFVIYFPTTFGVLIFAGGAVQAGLLLPLTFAAIVLGPSLMLVVKDVVEKRVVARSPEECWNPDEFEPVESARDVVS